MFPSRKTTEILEDMALMNFMFTFPAKLNRKQRVNSVDELVSLLKENSLNGNLDIQQDDGFYGRHVDFYYLDRIDSEGKFRKSYIAYGCPECNKIIIGPPKIIGENTISSEHILSGREGVDYRCHNCNSILKQKDYRVS